LEERIAVCLGGRVAEQLVLGDISTGASNDIQKASETARAMVTKYGMSETLGAIAYGSESDEIFIGRSMAQARTYSEEVAGQIDQEVKAIVDHAYARCEEILTQRRSELEVTAHYLLDHETMDAHIFAKDFDEPDADELANYRDYRDYRGNR
jgi:cell division protease FtsH